MKRIRAVWVIAGIAVASLALVLLLPRQASRTEVVAVYGAAPSNEQERDLVRVAALRFMMTKHAVSGREREHYSLYVLRDIGYVKRFAAFRPPVVPFEEGRYPASSGRAIDAKTGRPVKIWSVGREKMEGEKATVGIRWYYARHAAGWHTVFLVKKDGVWIVERDHMDAVSKKEPNKSLEPTLTARPFSFMTAPLETPSSLWVSVAHL